MTLLVVVLGVLAAMTTAYAVMLRAHVTQLRGRVAARDAHIDRLHENLTAQRRIEREWRLRAFAAELRLPVEGAQ